MGAGTDKIFINICSHSIVGKAQNHSGEEISNQNLLDRGLKTLRFPQFASMHRRVEGLGIVVDVLYHPSLVSRAVDAPSEQLMQAYKERLTELAVPFVHQDSMGVVSMNPHTIQFLQNSRYKGGKGTKGAEPIPIAVDIPEEGHEERPLIEEVPQARKTDKNKSPASTWKKGDSTVKKGFFDKKGGPGLYGPEGSKEGVVPDGAGDPLGYLPKGLREKMQVVDTNKKNQQQVAESAAEYAATGTSKFAEPSMAMKAKEAQAQPQVAARSEPNSYQEAIRRDLETKYMSAEEQAKAEEAELQRRAEEDAARRKAMKKAKAAERAAKQTEPQPLPRNPATASTDTGMWCHEEVAEECPCSEACSEAGDGGIEKPDAQSRVIKGEDRSDDVLEVTIGLPKVENIAIVDLEVTERSLLLQVDGMYHLNMTFQQCVDDDEVDAKFDKGKRRLVLHIPVKY